MRRYNIASRILLILTVIAFALAVPVLVQEKRQSSVDEVHVHEDVITVLGKRSSSWWMQDLDMLWGDDLPWGGDYHENLWGNRNPAGVHLQEPAPPPDVPPPNPAEVHVPEVQVPPQNPAGVHVPEVPLPPQNPADSDLESMELDDDAPPASPESGYSDSTPTSSGWSSESEDWHTPPSSLGSSTESDSDSGRWSTISNAPSAESHSENLKAADTEMRGKAKVSRHISDIVPPIVLTL